MAVSAGALSAASPARADPSGGRPPTTGGSYASHEPRPGAASAGERLFPSLGNGGYDVQSYDVGYDYRPGVMTMESSVDIVARATQALTGFSLDSAGQRIESVSVQGEKAAFRSSDEKLFITPKNPPAKGQLFRVHISFSADRTANPPSPSTPTVPPNFLYWYNTDDGFSLFGQPDRAHLFFPMNDIPRDKARVTFRITTPKDLQAVAGGTLRSHSTAGDRTTYVYSTRDPIPTDVVQAAVGRFKELDQRGPHGLPLRSYVDTDDFAKATPQVKLVPGQVDWAEKELGVTFPFETYGVLGLEGGYAAALESPTLSTFSAAAGLTKAGHGNEGTMVHELVHQYFGDAVSVDNWDDMWLSEGHASYYTFRFMADKGYVENGTYDDNIRRAYEFDRANRAQYGPPGRPGDTADVLGGTNAGGVVMLDGLHRMVGDATFRRIERTFLEKYRNASATTQDYIDVANAVAGRDLTAYIRSWIYGATTPPAVGHPDWPAPAKAGESPAKES
jgi:aminopeptidase N